MICDARECTVTQKERALITSAYSTMLNMLLRNVCLGSDDDVVVIDEACLENLTATWKRFKLARRGLP